MVYQLGTGAAAAGPGRELPALSLGEEEESTGLREGALSVRPPRIGGWTQQCETGIVNDQRRVGANTMVSTVSVCPRVDPPVTVAVATATVASWVSR